MDWQLNGTSSENDIVKMFTQGEGETISTSYTTSENIDFAIQGVGISLLTIIGLSGNVLSVIVLTRPKLKSPSTTLLLGLTISDICFTTGFIYLSLKMVIERLNVFPSYSSLIEPWVFPWSYPICFTAQTSSIYFTVIITLERYFAICQQPKNRSIFSTSVAALGWSVFVVLFSILYNISRFFEFETIPVLNDANEVTSYEITAREWIYYYGYDLYYGHWGYLIVIVVIPFTVLVSFNIAIFRAVKQYSETRARTATEDIQLATMLLGIVITFLLCHFLSLLYLLRTIAGIDGEIFDHAGSIRNFLIVFSHSSNFIFYCAFGSRFRRQLQETLGISQRHNTDVDLENSSTYPDGNSCTLLEHISSNNDDSNQIAKATKKGETIL